MSLLSKLVIGCSALSASAVASGGIETSSDTVNVKLHREAKSPISKAPKGAHRTAAVASDADTLLQSEATAASATEKGGRRSARRGCEGEGGKRKVRSMIGV
jgi:hypothetical protein